MRERGEPSTMTMTGSYTSDAFTELFGGRRGRGRTEPNMRALTRLLLAYEDETISPDEELQLFQALIDSGLAWKMEGRFGRAAMQLIQDGWCALGEQRYVDSYGNRVPSLHDIAEGAPGSLTGLRHPRPAPLAEA